MKTCTKCNLLKSFIKFRKDKRGKDGLRSQCNDCEKISRNDKLLSKKRSSLNSILCNLCNVTKPLDQFNNASDSKCKSCLRNRRFKNRRQNKILTPKIQISNDTNFYPTQSSINNFFNVFNYNAKADNIELVTNDLENAIRQIVSQTPSKISVEVEFLMQKNKNPPFIMTKKTDKLSFTDENFKQSFLKLIYTLNDIISSDYYEQSGLSFKGISTVKIYANRNIYLII